MTTVELRCDRNPSRLLAKIDRPRIVEGNLIEIACRDCKKAEHAMRVLHRFNVLGELIETVVERDPL